MSNKNDKTTDTKATKDNDFDGFDMAPEFVTLGKRHVFRGGTRSPDGRDPSQGHEVDRPAHHGG
jgi:hypothetical protein